jgi:hypothetical protein
MAPDGGKSYTPTFASMVRHNPISLRHGYYRTSKKGIDGSIDRLLHSHFRQRSVGWVGLGPTTNPDSQNALGAARADPNGTKLVRICANLLPERRG